jgi:hypothetical protein
MKGAVTLHILIEGRKVFLREGRLTQTVNICDIDNRYGVYDWIVKLNREEKVEYEDISGFTSRSKLIKWLTEEKNGELTKEKNGTVEEQPQEEDTSTFKSRFTKDDNTWIERAVQVTDACLDQLVLEFLDLPYLHRVESSIHARLYTILSGQPHFARHFKMCEDGILTQPIHKEWPAPIPLEGSNRRGLFDLAILPPGRLSKCSCLEFDDGRMAPPIAIEMGLNYPVLHLRIDAEKFINSKIKHGYLVHLIRKNLSKHEIKTYNDAIVEIGKAAGDTCNIRVAFAQFTERKKHLKLLSDSKICKVQTL